MSTQSRQPKGIPVGGQFAASTHAESGVTLDPVDTAGEEQDLTPVASTFEFPAWKVPAAVASIETANRRAERAGIPERFGYQVETWEVRGTDPETGLTTVTERARLTLDRPTLRHDGWTFAATLTWDDEAGMISRAAPGATLLERPTERLCDVCGTTRDRKDTYVIQRDGVQMQVGSNCLAQFMGITPAGLFMLDFDPDTSADPSDEPPMRHGESRRDSTEVLALGLAVVEQHGWLSRSAAFGTPATADRVIDLFSNRNRTTAEKRDRDALLARGKEMVAEAAEVLDAARETDGDSDYVINLRAVAGADTVTDRNLPLLLSGIAASRRAQEKAAEEKARAETAAVSQWVGQEKDKVADVKVTIVGTNVREATYGGRTTYTTIISMRDSDGNAWKWWASGNKEGEVKPGQSMTMRGTIKGHDEYRGLKETIVTRAKLEPREG